MPFPFSPKQTNIPAQLQRVSMPPDGNCLFYAVAGALRGDAKSAREWMPRVLKNKPLFNRDMTFLRGNVANFLSKEAITKRNMDYFYLMGATPDQVEAYIESVRTNKWADDLEITALMKIYHRPIYVIDASGHLRSIPNETIIGDEHGNIGDPIFVYYHQHGNPKSKSATPNHYDLLIVKKGYDAREIARSLVEETETYNHHKAEVDRAYRLLHPLHPNKPAPGEAVPPSTPTTRAATIVPPLYYPGDFDDMLNIGDARKIDSRRSSPTSSNGTSENTSISSLKHAAPQSPPKVAPYNHKDPATAEFDDLGLSPDSSSPRDDASSSTHRNETGVFLDHLEHVAASAKALGRKQAQELERQFNENTLADNMPAAAKLQAEHQVLLEFLNLAIIAATDNVPNQQEYIEGLVDGINNLNLKLKVIHTLVGFYDRFNTTHTHQMTLIANRTDRYNFNKLQSLITTESRIIAYLTKQSRLEDKKLKDEKAKFNTDKKRPKR